MGAWFAGLRASLVSPEELVDRWVKRLDDLERLGPGDLMPWIVIPFLSVPVALLIGVPTAGVGLGVVIGALGAIAVAAYAVVRSRRQAAETERLIADAHEDADRRVALVTKQFEWAVNDVANLRDALRSERAARPSGRDWADELRRGTQPVQPEAAVVTTPAPSAETPATIRVEPRAVAAEQVRIVNEQGAVVAISARLLDANADGNSAFVMRVGDETAQAIAESQGSLRIEVLVDDEWRPLERKDVAPANPPIPMTPAQRAQGPIADKRGRVYATTSS